MRLWVLFLPLALLATEIRIDTTRAEAQDSRIEIQNSFSLQHPDYFIQAGYGIYDKNSSRVRLYEDVQIIDSRGYGIYATKGELELEKDRLKLEHFLFNETKTHLWVKGKRAHGDKRKLTLERSFLSSCGLECSDWKFSFSSGDHDKEAHWVNLYNILFYIKDVPVFYFPYIGFSTLKERTTGFLRPTFGISNQEGFVYIQPFFYAPKNWWDLELDPQIRTRRGKGLYATFRFVDSPTSYGEIRTGVFMEDRSYQERMGIQNRYHRGVEFFYRKQNIFGFSDAQDGLYLDYKIYNDVDYFNLQSELSRRYRSSLNISRLNYYYADDRNYFGLSARYYKYNTKSSSNELFHILPALEYHRFVTTPMEGFNIAYNLDSFVTHYYQRGGYDAIEYDVRLPIKFYLTLVEGYLGFSVTERLSLLYTDYFGREEGDPYYKDYFYFRNAHDLSLYGDVVKPYESFLHTVSYSANLLVPSYEQERGDRSSFSDIEEYRKSLDLSIKQYFRFYDSNLFLYHFLTQRFEYDSPQDARYIQNEVGVATAHWNLSTDLSYSYQKSDIDAFTLAGSYRGEDLRTSLSYIYRKRYDQNGVSQGSAQFFRADMHQDLANHNELFATIDYNIELGRYKAWSVGWRKRKRCWSFTLQYKRDTIPALTSSGVGYYNDNAVMFRIELYPLGGFEHSFINSGEQRIL